MARDWKLFEIHKQALADVRSGAVSPKATVNIIKCINQALDMRLYGYLHLESDPSELDHLKQIAQARLEREVAA